MSIDDNLSSIISQVLISVPIYNHLYNLSNLHINFLNFKNVIICGDFNSNLIWENPFWIDKVHKEVVDDLEENTDAAHKLGIHTWNLVPGKEDVTELFTKKHI